MKLFFLLALAPLHSTPTLAASPDRVDWTCGYLIENPNGDLSCLDPRIDFFRMEEDQPDIRIGSAAINAKERQSTLDGISAIFCKKLGLSVLQEWQYSNSGLKEGEQIVSLDKAGNIKNISNPIVDPNFSWPVLSAIHCKVAP